MGVSDGARSDPPRSAAPPRRREGRSPKGPASAVKRGPYVAGRINRPAGASAVQREGLGTRDAVRGQAVAGLEGLDGRLGLRPVLAVDRDVEVADLHQVGLQRTD